MNIFKANQMRKVIGKKEWKWSYLGIKQIPHVKKAIYIFILKLKAI